jgi:hypothetical protein
MILKLKVKALSYNQYYRNSRTGKRIKTGAGLAYDEILGEALGEYAEALKEFGGSVDLSRSIVKIEILNFKSNFFTKKGAISKTSGDWDNPVKVLQDKIFALVGVDDYIIKEGTVKVLPSDTDGVIIRLSLEPIPPVSSFDDFTVW